ncbi:hypothetical protein MUK42_29729 [Musa troglodytarum]|uniref:CASP-like protein n=1 Tax=Musa troglodytarum TaxID=320322 RepID=A0A9E7KXS7_9LILI|nr:hypothetical protein MUK42_29729 [Musa troglodytarum]
MASGGSVAVSPVTVASPAAQNHHFYHYLSPFTATTPSPYVNSPTAAAAAAAHWISRPSLLRRLNLLLRFLGFALSFASSLSLALPSPQKASGRQRSFGFQHHPEFRYCIGATIVASFYSALQLSKGIWDIAFKGFPVSGKVSDYITFFFDQVVAYLLMSSSSVCLLATQLETPSRFRAAAIVSTTASFAAFLAVAASAVLAGYTLCKRIIW